ncbi:MAG: gfo/Idh/MocA family oxidoreductase, partial [Chloroflexi bacterium]|nr:gfo/Idh/MocA family oxidoreductase [Chloroflexota bacterium]
MAIIGHTGRGGYGHHLDRAFQGVEGTRVIAVSDPDEAARERVRAIYGSPVGYADYREMLARERPDITVVA